MRKSPLNNQTNESSGNRGKVIGEHCSPTHRISGGKPLKGFPALMSPMSWGTATSPTYSPTNDFPDFRPLTASTKRQSSHRPRVTKLKVKPNQSQNRAL